MLSPVSVFFPPAQRFFHLLLLSTLLLSIVQAQRSFPPWLGCDDTFSQGIPTTGRDDECYAVDSSLCRYAFRDGCRETLATYYYYMGGIDTDYPYQEYYRVSVRAANAACNRTCYVKVNGQECEQCSQGDDDYRVVTLNDCSNIPGVFPIGPQAINVVKDKQAEGNPQYFQLAYNETRCQHPALQQPFTTPPETQLPTNTTDSNNTSTNNTTMNDGGNISMAPSLEATFLIPAEEEEDDLLEYKSTPTSSPTTTDMSTSLRGGSGGFGRVDSRDEAPTSKESIKKQKQSSSSTETTQIVVHPKFKLLSCSRLSSSSSAGTAISDNEEEEDKEEPQPSLSNTESTLSLIEDTNTFLGLLLRQYIPHLMDASMTDLATGPASISASDEDACDMSSVTDSSSDMFLNFTLTLTMVVPDDDKTTTPAITTRQVAEYVADNHHLNDYVHTVVQKSFPQVHTVRAWVTS